MSLAYANAAASSPAVVDLVDSDEQEENEDARNEQQEENSLVLLDRVDDMTASSCRIVGIRYYRGTAHPGEFVTLVREPHNPYDKNAIRVDNLNGQKVGHVKREMASKIAGLLDRYKGKLYVDASIPRAGDSFSLPLQLEFRVPPQHLLLRGSLEKALKAVKKSRRYSSAMSYVPPSVPLVTPSKSQALATVATETKILNWEDQQKELEKLFEDQSRRQLEDLPPLVVPDCLITPLLDHQVQAVRWLLRREQNDSVPNPFFQNQTEGGRSVWLCKITQSSQAEAPKLVRGGILADDMGLGKTLSSLALILCHPPPGRPTFGQAARPLAAMPRKPVTTLIVCPVSVISNWQSQIAEHVKPNTLRVGLYYGSNRHQVLDSIHNMDIVLTSYSTLQHDFRVRKTAHKPVVKKSRKSGFSGSIFDIPFFRVLLDEAHTIRNAKSLTYKACASLQADCRLCLTGTPLQNKPEDILSLLMFLRLEPFDPQVFRRAIKQPIQEGQPEGLARLRAVLSHVALRRSKKNVQTKLPTKTVELRLVDYGLSGSNIESLNPHAQIYHALLESARKVFRSYGGDDTLLAKSTDCIFEILLRLRQSCCSGQLVPPERIQRAENVLKLLENRKDPLTQKEAKELLDSLKGVLLADTSSDDLPECAICLDTLQESAAVVLRGCRHVFCQDCMGRMISSLEHTSTAHCPLCRQEFQTSDVVPWHVASQAAAESNDQESAESTLSDNVETLGPSPKQVALLAALREMKDGEKGVIFSQFTKFLDRLQVSLDNEGVSYSRIDGTMSATKRAAALKVFASKEGGPQIMLCSLHAAGTGINLTRANHIFLMDTWWNQAVEAQAQDRVHRIGQELPVRVVRFVAAGTCEARMVELQEAKAAVGKGAFENLSPDERRKARLGDLKRLLDI